MRKYSWMPVFATIPFVALTTAGVLHVRKVHQEQLSLIKAAEAVRESTPRLGVHPGIPDGASVLGVTHNKTNGTKVSGSLAVPKELRDYQAALLEQPLNVGIIKKCEAALQDAIPDERLRIRTLLTWLGSVETSCNEAASYQQVPEELLVNYDTESVIAAIEMEDLTTSETEGANRYFTGYEFYTRRPTDLKLLPQNLKAHLYSHALASGNKDKIGRTAHALAF